MSMLNTFSTRMTVLAALVAGSTLVACGDDTKLHGAADAKPSTIDAPTFDASPADAGVDAMPTAEVAGTVAVTDVKVLDSDATAVGGITGGSVTATFSDLTMNGGTVVAGTTQVNGCVVVKYDPTHLPNPPMDAGLIKITNNPANETPPTGLLKTVGMAGNCSFSAALKQYLCVSNAVVGTGTVVGTNLPNNPPTMPPGLIAYTFPADASIANEKLVGSYLIVAGFTTTPSFNSPTGGAFPIVSQNGDTLVVVNAAAEGAGATTETVTGTASYTILNGFNPVPIAGAAADFLGTGSITVQKVMSTGFKAFSQNIDVPGQGFSLSDPGDPTMIPLTGTATDLTFGCGANPATCGDGSTTLIQATILSGRATKKSVAGLPNYSMPTEVPGTDTWLEFTCGFIGTHSATFDAAALQAIIDFAPTRVEMRVINAAGNIITDTGLPGNPQTFVIAGHALVGHTTAP